MQVVVSQEPGLENESESGEGRAADLCAFS